MCNVRMVYVGIKQGSIKEVALMCDTCKIDEEKR